MVGTSKLLKSDMSMLIKIEKDAIKDMLWHKESAVM